MALELVYFLKLQKQVMCVCRAASWEIHVTLPEKPCSRSIVIPVVRSSQAMEGDSLEAVTGHRADGHSLEAVTVHRTDALSLAVAIVLREDVRKVDALNSEVDDRADSEVVRQAVWTVNQS